MLNEQLKAQESAFKANCKRQLANLQAQLKDVSASGGADDEESAKIKEIEDMHVKVMAKYDKLRQLVAERNLAIAAKVRLIDDIPTRTELIQYERRFVELYSQVALKLGENKKYFETYNTLEDTYKVRRGGCPSRLGVGASLDCLMSPFLSRLPRLSSLTFSECLHPTPPSHPPTLTTFPSSSWRKRLTSSTRSRRTSTPPCSPKRPRSSSFSRWVVGPLKLSPMLAVVGRCWPLLAVAGRCGRCGIDTHSRPPPTGRPTTRPHSSRSLTCSPTNALIHLRTYHPHAQFESIIKGVQDSLQRQNTTLEGKAVRLESLAVNHQNLVDEQRRYFKAVKDFQEECNKNELYSQKLAQLGGPLEG